MQFVKFCLSIYFRRKYCLDRYVKCLPRGSDNIIMFWIICKTPNSSHQITICLGYRQSNYIINKEITFPPTHFFIKTNNALSHKLTSQVYRSVNFRLQISHMHRSANIIVEPFFYYLSVRDKWRYTIQFNKLEFVSLGGGFTVITGHLEEAYCHQAKNSA